MPALVEEIKDGLEAIRDDPGALIRHDLSAPDIRAIREKFQLSQSQMATFLGVKTKTLQNWEQGIRNPTASAQTLLLVLEKEPDAVLRALRN